MMQDAVIWNFNDPRNTTSNVGLDAKKYNGTENFEEDSLAIQQQLSNEGERKMG